jgi:hypothetical protein
LYHMIQKNFFIFFILFPSELKDCAEGRYVIHLLFSSLSAAIYVSWERQVKKAKDAHKVIKEAIRSERREIEQLRQKYLSLLDKKRDIQKNPVNDTHDVGNSHT